MFASVNCKNSVCSFTTYAEVLANSMIVLEHLLIRSHVEISIESVQVAICQLVGATDDSTHFD